MKLLFSKFNFRTRRRASCFDSGCRQSRPQPHCPQNYSKNHCPCCCNRCGPESCHFGASPLKTRPHLCHLEYEPHKVPDPFATAPIQRLLQLAPLALGSGIGQYLLHFVLAYLSSQSQAFLESCHPRRSSPAPIRTRSSASVALSQPFLSRVGRPVSSLLSLRIVPHQRLLCKQTRALGEFRLAWWPIGIAKESDRVFEKIAYVVFYNFKNLLHAEVIWWLQSSILAGPR